MYKVTIDYMGIDEATIVEVNTFNYILIGLQLVFPDKSILVVPSHRLWLVRIKEINE